MKKNKKSKAHKNLLIAAAMDFSAFLLSNEKTGTKINKIILFGSVARNEHDAESDIDLFVDTEQPEDYIRTLLNLWEKSKRADEWRLLGVSNPIALHIGRLEKWETIRRDVLSEGILLYGKYLEQRRGEKHYMLITMRIPMKSKSTKIGLWRKLYGYKQKIGKKIYETKGLVEEYGGARAPAGTLIIPIENSQKLLEFLRKEGAKFTTRSVWGD